MAEVVSVVKDQPDVVGVVKDLPEVVSVSLDPKPKQRSAIDQLLFGTREVVDESLSMGLEAASASRNPLTVAKEIGHGLLQSNLDPLIDTVKGAFTAGAQAIAAPFHAALGGAHAIAVEPVMAGLGADEEQIRAARGNFELIAGTAVPMAAEARAFERGGAAMARTGGKPASGMADDAAGARKPVIDPESGATILKNPPADEALQAEVVANLRAHGIDPTDRVAVAEFFAKREGVPVPKIDAPEGQPISKTSPDGSEVKLEPGTPGEEATRLDHEVGNHVPEKLGLREAPVEDNNLLALEGLEKERATFATPVEPGQGLPGPHVPASINPALEVLNGAREAGEEMSRRMTMVYEQERGISTTGTISKETREAFREATIKPETKNLRISEADVENYGKKLIQSVRSLKDLLKNQDFMDPISQTGIRMAFDSLDIATEQWNALRFGAGRTVGRFGKTLDDSLKGLSNKEIKEIQAQLKNAGVSLEGSQLARQALWTEGWKALARGDGWAGLTDLTRFTSLNLFSALSWSVDALTSAYRHTSQATGYLGRDLTWMAKGHPNFPNFGAFIRSLKRPLPKSVADEMSGAIAGEASPGGIPFYQIGKKAVQDFKEGGLRHALTQEVDLGSGAATHRSNIGSAVFDEATMLPAYMKRSVDSLSGNVGARVKMSALADEFANARGLTGDKRAAFIDDFIKGPEKFTKQGELKADVAAQLGRESGLKGKELQSVVDGFMNDSTNSAIDDILRTGHELQWKHDITNAERMINNSNLTRWFFSAFPSWPSQFVRGMADTLGIRPATWARIKKGGYKPEDVMEVLGRAGTGWGGIALLNQFYDMVDFDSMEVVVPGIGRLRMSSADPLPEMFGLLAVMKGLTQDADKALNWGKVGASIKHGSIPIVSGYVKLGGILSPLAENFKIFAQRGTLNVQKIEKEMTDMVNSWFPAQATMAALKSLIDPVQRRGVGANIPVYSETLPEKVETTTGDDAITLQRIGQVRFQNIAGAPIRGAIRETDAVYELLDYYVPESLIRTGVRTPVADTPIADIPMEWQDEYKKSFGKLRWEYLTSKRFGALAGKFQNGEIALEKGSPEYERIRKRILHLDSLAARRAVMELKKKYGHKKPARRPTILERSGAGYEYNPESPPPPPSEPEPPPDEEDDLPTVVGVTKD